MNVEKRMCIKSEVRDTIRHAVKKAHNLCSYMKQDNRRFPLDGFQYNIIMLLSKSEAENLPNDKKIQPTISERF